MSGADESQPATLPYGFAKRQGILLGPQQEQAVSLLCRSDCTPSAVAEVRRLLDRPIRIQVMEAGEFNRRLALAYEHGESHVDNVIADVEDGVELDRVAESLPEPEDLLESEDDAPIIRLINAILSQAVRENASDIHIEPQETGLVVRLRVDGRLREVLQASRKLTALVVSRIKVMARLNIAERRVPQDGRISLRVGGRAVDMRVSTLPAAHGERVVLRLLDKQAGRLDLGHLGLDPAIHALLRELVHRPHGIVLVTGPTGSGKTTTLYAALQEINDQTRNILTVEDPVEYYLEGIGQTQVNTKVDMSFARGLRAILRQDPDVVMVGEIRDRETAEIAVQAGLTGHLVLSTLHTNTAVGAITRLRDMGVEPFLLSSTLLATLAQRLVRTLCPECRRAYAASDSEKEMLGLSTGRELTLYREGGCAKCGGTGFRGRTGIYELVLIDEGMRGLIHDRASEPAMQAAARMRTPSIAVSGQRLVIGGSTTLEEVLRVTRTD